MYHAHLACTYCRKRRIRGNRSNDGKICQEDMQKTPLIAGASPIHHPTWTASRHKTPHRRRPAAVALRDRGGGTALGSTRYTGAISYFGPRVRRDHPSQHRHARRDLQARSAGGQGPTRDRAADPPLRWLLG